MRANNLVGERFGKLTVIGRAENSPSGKTKWYCVCDCGNAKENPVMTSDLVSGKVRSCGCLYKESNRGRNAKHSMTNSRLYNIWLSMRQRCGRNKIYIVKSITVCDEWRNNFQAFYDWAMANGYSDNLTIDRIDVNDNYCPENCRWATMKVQQNNRTNNRKIFFEGEELTVSELSDLIGIPYATLLYRINHGWDLSELEITPDFRNKFLRRKKYEHN